MLKLWCSVLAGEAVLFLEPPGGRLGLLDLLLSLFLESWRFLDWLRPFPLPLRPGERPRSDLAGLWLLPLLPVAWDAERPPFPNSSLSFLLILESCLYEQLSREQVGK